MKLLKVGGQGKGEGTRGDALDSAPLSPPLQDYQKGVIKATPSSCDPQHVDHSVLLVGFGKEKAGMQTGTVLSHPRKPRRSTPFWILKNSWGDGWGEKVSGGRKGAVCNVFFTFWPDTPNFLGLLQALPGKQHLWNHQVSIHSSSEPTS